MADDNDEGKEKDNSKETASLNKRLKKHEGDAMALAAELSAENADLNRQLNAAKGQKPKEGSLVLTPEQAKHWEAFIALGKPEEVIAAHQAYKEHGTPEEVKTKLTEHAALTTENTSLKKTEELRKYADVVVTIDGKKKKAPYGILELIDTKAGGLTFEMRDTTADGKTEPALHVKDGNKFTLFSEYVRTNHPALLPSLIDADGTSSSGTRVPSQTADDKTTPPKEDLGAEFFKKVQEARDKKVNPLAKTA